MRRPERPGEASARSHATRIVPAVAPGGADDSMPTLRTAIPAPDARRFASPSAGRRQAGPYEIGPSVVPTTRRNTAAPRTLGDTAARAAITVDTRSRRASQARRLRAGDTALVTATTQLLAVVEPVAEERAIIAMAPALDLEASAEWADEREPVTILVPTLPPTRSALIRLGAPPPHPHPHARRARLAVISAMLVACMLVAIRFALPLTQDTSQPAAYTSHLPDLTSGQLAAPTGPWSTGSGVADTLGLGGGAAPGTKAPGSAGAPVKTSQPAAKQQSGSPAPSSASNGILPAPLHPWPPSDPFMYVSGHPSFGMSDVGGYYYWAFGQCTWWSQYKKQNENLTHMGSAMYWAASAARRGYRIGSTPVAGATVVYQPGVQGAGGYGHVAHVEAVYPDGWFLESEMNFYVNGGGWGRVDYRYAHAGWGVSFIY